MRIALTGSTGFIGRAVTPRLMREQGIVVRAVTRHPESAPPAHEVTSCPDLQTGTPEEWRCVLDGVDVAIHLAARLPWHGDDADPAAYATFARANCHGAIAFAEGLAAAGGRRLVFLSSIGVNGVVSGERPFTADDPPRVSGNYARSKWEAESGLRSLCRQRGVELVIVRPPIVYGPGVSGRFKDLVDAVVNRRLIPLGGVRDNQRDMIGITNLADFLAVAARHPGAANHTYLVCDHEPMSTAALVTALGAAYGIRPRLFTVPAGLLRLAGWLPATRGLLARLLGDARLDDSEARDSLGWTPPCTVADELRHMATGQFHAPAARIPPATPQRW